MVFVSSRIAVRKKLKMKRVVCPLGVYDKGHAIALLIALTLFGAALVLGAIACSEETINAPELNLRAPQEVQVDCDTMTIEQARTFLEENDLLEYLEGQNRTDEQLLEDAKAICKGDILPNPNT